MPIKQLDPRMIDPAKDVVIKSLTVTNYTVLTSSAASITFSNADSGKTYNVNTTTQPSVTALFPGSLSNGFNVSIINAGTGTIYLSAGSQLNASGSENSTPYSGRFIYKTNNELFGVGVFV